MLYLLAALVIAAPPSSTLTGPTGQLSWQVEQTGDRVHIIGRSPRWTVTHVATAELRPIRTERVDPDGRKVSVYYRSTGTEVVLPEGSVTIDRSDLWDADTLDVRLGYEVAHGKTKIDFPAVDSKDGAWYWFDAKVVGEETCGARACKRVKVQLSGWRRSFGPTFMYWYGDGGELLKFEGPGGKFSR